MEVNQLPELRDRYGYLITRHRFVKLLVSKGGMKRGTICKIVFSPAQHRWGLKYVNSNDDKEYEEINDCSFYLTPRLAINLQVL